MFALRYRSFMRQLAGLGHVALFCVLAACTSLGPPPTVTPLPTLTVTPPTPEVEGVATTFLEAWEHKDYAAMYSLLSPLSQAAISPADFTARYTEAARTTSQTELEAQILSAFKNGAAATVLFEVNWHTAVVGTLTRKIEMPLVYVEGRWAVAWSDGLILPELAGGNTLVMEHTVPARANIYDRNGLGLAVQGEAVAVGVQPNLMQDEPAVLQALATLFNTRTDVIQKKYANARPDWYVPIGEASAEDVQAQYATLSTLAGVILTRYNTRYYPHGGVAPQVMGYLGNIPPEQLADYQARGYTGDERVGQAGLEAWGEPYLSGQRGGQLYVVSPSGQVVAELAESQSQVAQAIYTTLDRPLQLAAQEALGGFRGAIVVLRPDTGEVLALASNPTFDPNLFDPTNRNSSGPEGILNDAGRPLLNRATQGVYPPGSVFKVPMMAAAMLSGLYNSGSSYTCTGVWRTLGANAVKYDWTVALGVSPHGPINLIESLAYSCDPYYYTIAYDLYQYDENYAAEVARQFGFGSVTQLAQLPEAPGLIPDPAWKRTTYGEDWTPGDSVNMGIGQGYVLATPMQVAVMMAAMRNGGTLYQPQLVAKIAPPGGDPTYQFKPIVNGTLPVDEEQLQVLQAGLYGVTTFERGTAHFVFPNSEVPVAGKTGTAEDPAQGAPHAWFAGYTEANLKDKPDIAIVVLVENIGEGSQYAAPIFRRIVEVYFQGRPYTLYPWETEFGTPGETPTPTP